MRVWGFHATRKPQLAIGEGLPEGGDEFAAEYSSEYFHRQEEGIAWSHPASAVRRNTAFRDHAMDMRMMFEFLVPGMQHAEKANVGAEMAWIVGDFQ